MGSSPGSVFRRGALNAGNVNQLGLLNRVSLQGRVALVTGGGTTGAEYAGVGEAVCRTVGRAGATVVVVDKVGDFAEATAAVLETEGTRAFGIQCDVSSDESCSALAEKLKVLGLEPDIVVNNVGVFGPPGGAANTSIESWNLTFEVNVTSVLRVAHITLPNMVRRGSGAIVNISSIAGLAGVSGNLAYSTTKGAIVSMSRAMAIELGPLGIRVNTVAPGYIYTPMVERKGMTDEIRDRRRRLAPLEIEGTAWNVADAVLFLVSGLSSWITGVTLPVDGGVLAELAQLRDKG